jgi:glyoxylase-like metal-dependent hydrolase (beta-lactamase superfamily II)
VGPQVVKMNTLTSGLSYIDLQFLGVPRVIATAVLAGPDGVMLIDPGPSSTLPTLLAELERAGIALSDVRGLLLTHIHLDHAGASGTLVHQNPKLRVYVHEKGAPHMTHPEKLLASAARLYGNDMDRLWGAVLPVPSEALVVLTGEDGADRISGAGRTLDVAYTPGHASHHVSYFDQASGIAFVGDTVGIRLYPESFVMPPTPPPDIDLEIWRDSFARIAAWRPGTLFITHFGAHAPVDAHMAEMRDHLEVASGLVKASLAREGTDAEREAWFIDEMRQRLQRRATPAEVRAYEVAGRLDLSWRGLARYWRKKH